MPSSTHIKSLFKNAQAGDKKAQAKLRLLKSV
jgi:hypothetical protein